MSESAASTSDLMTSHFTVKASSLVLLFDASVCNHIHELQANSPRPAQGLIGIERCMSGIVDD